LNELTGGVFDAVAHAFNILPDPPDSVATAAGGEANKGAGGDEKGDGLGFRFHTE